MADYVCCTRRKVLYARAITIVIYGLCAFTPLFLLYWSTQATFIPQNEVLAIFVISLIVFVIMMFLLDIYVKYILDAPIPFVGRSVDADWLLSSTDCRDV